MVSIVGIVIVVWGKCLIFGYLGPSGMMKDLSPDPQPSSKKPI